MTYPKWRHHPEQESMIVHNEDQEVSQAGEGWFDTRDFAAEEPEAPSKRPYNRKAKA